MPKRQVRRAFLRSYYETTNNKKQERQSVYSPFGWVDCAVFIFARRGYVMIRAIQWPRSFSGLIMATLFLASCAKQETQPPSRSLVEDIKVFACLGGWEDNLRTAYADTSIASNRLESALSVKWNVEGDVYDVEVTRESNDWCGLLGIEFVFAANMERIVYGIEDVPVSIPVSGLRPGIVCASWTENTPWWLLASTKDMSLGILVETEDGHGFRSYFGVDSELHSAQNINNVNDTVNSNETTDATVTPDGKIRFQIRFRIPKIGETKRMRFRIVENEKVNNMRQMARELRGLHKSPPIDHRAARNLRKNGFIELSDDKTKFSTSNGNLFYPVGLNEHSGQLLTMPPERQDEILRKMADAGMNTLRIIAFDWIFHPAPGVWNAAAMKQLKETIERCAAHGIRVIICLEYPAAAYQYSISLHHSPIDQDIYFMKEMLRDYETRVDFIVKPLKDDPAVMAWTVSNEPSHMLKPSDKSRITNIEFRKWLKEKYKTPQNLSAVWNISTPTDFNDIFQPDAESYKNQSTPIARNFFDFQNSAIAEAMINRARLIKAVDTKHLIGISDGFSRRLKGHSDAGIFDFHAPHTYDIWSNGNEISRHVLFLLAQHRDAVPGCPRPVIVEEFGISEQPQFPSAMRAEHIRKFIKAGKRHGMAGIIQWWNVDAAAYAAISAEMPYTVSPTPPNTPIVAVYLPPSQEWNLVFYNCIGIRRKWENMVAAIVNAGFEINIVASPNSATNAVALLVLAQPQTERELPLLHEFTNTIILSPETSNLKSILPEANVLPTSYKLQKSIWSELFNKPKNSVKKD